MVNSSSRVDSSHASINRVLSFAPHFLIFSNIVISIGFDQYSTKIFDAQEVAWYDVQKENVMTTKYYACDHCEVLYMSDGEAYLCESRHTDCQQYRIIRTGSRSEGNTFPDSVSLVSSEDGEMMARYKLDKVKRRGKVE